jgi:acetylglutamate kinase
MTTGHGVSTDPMRVVKLGGRAQEDPAVLDAIAAAWRARPGTLCVVHGGGGEVTALQAAMGIEARFVGGRRVTGEGDIALLRMALSGLANKRLVAALAARGVRAIGLSGEDGGLLSAFPVGGEMGLVGRPSRVDDALLGQLAALGLLVVLSPVSASDAGDGALNVNGDDAATAVAIALGAEELLFVSDVAGVRLDGRERGAIGADELPSVLTRPDVSGGMVAKLEAARDAVAGGVGRVRIGDASILVDGSGGTVIERRRSAA